MKSDIFTPIVGDLPSAPRVATRGRECGFVLIAVLVFVMLLSMIAMSLLFRFKGDETAVVASGTSEQAWAAALSGVEEALRIARQSAPGSTDWRDNRRAFRERLLFEDGGDRWFFTVFSPPDDDSTEEWRYGLTDEASKININLPPTGIETLGTLPKMTPALVQSLRDFTDTDNTVQTEGAEQEYYSGLSRPYAVRNGALATLDELLLVRGFNPLLLYGEDQNFNSRLDATENDADENWPPDNNDGRLDRGLRQFLTVTSYEPEVTHEGARRSNLNDPAAPLPNIELPPPLTNFLATLHATKQTLRHPADLLEGTLRSKDNTGGEIEVLSGVGKEELSVVLDQFTTVRSPQRKGLININTASIAVLVTIPGIDDPLAESIASTRKSISPERRTTIAWLVQEGVVDAARFKQIAPYITARSFQFSFQVIGYGVPSGRYRILDVLVDVAGNESRVLYLRDLTRMGLPFRINTDPEGTRPAEASIAPGALRPFSMSLRRNFPAHDTKPHG